MTYRVVITKRAESALDSAAEWWAKHHSSNQAVRWYSEFMVAIRGLDTNPLQHPVARENSRFADEIRALHFGLGSKPTHRAIFMITKDIVLVVTIRHAAQDEIRPGDVDELQ